ncbi:MAG: GtrA family protein [Solirubrobacterales bacterium]|nr:GtrA family protein [Solirubrobacterales bacterium]
MSVVAVNGRLHIARAFLRDARSPRWGLAGQGMRFALSGCVVAIVYVATTTLLHEALAAPFQVALAIGFATSVTLHFTLQRLFVWRHYASFALAPHHQAVRYLGVCATQYAITALSTSQLPSLLGVPVEAIYVITTLAVAGGNFIVFRHRVFHAVPGYAEIAGSSARAGSPVVETTPKAESENVTA